MSSFPNASNSFKKINLHLFSNPEPLGLTERGPNIDPQSEKEESLQTKSSLKLERELQRDIVNLLNLRGIEVLRNRTDKKSTGTVGWPDLTFAWWREIDGEMFACAWEVKLPKEKLRPSQEALRPKLEANGWRWRLITSVDEALAELKGMGIE